jgi:hypothetical protein
MVSLIGAAVALRVTGDPRRRLGSVAPFSTSHADHLARSGDTAFADSHVAPDPLENDDSHCNRLESSLLF